MSGKHVDFRHGTTRKLDYTPSAAKEGGEVVVVGARPGVVQTSLAANEKGSLNIGGVYDGTAGAAIAEGDAVYWNATAGKLNNAAGATTGDKHFGFGVPGSTAAADGDTIRVEHEPDGSAAS